MRLFLEAESILCSNPCVHDWLIQGLTTDPSRVQQKVFKDGHHLFLSFSCEFATPHIQRSLFSPMLESGLILANFSTKDYGRSDAIWYQSLGQKKLCSFDLSPLEHLLLELRCYTVGVSSSPHKEAHMGRKWGLPIDGLTELPADNQEPPTSHVNGPSWNWIFQQHQLLLHKLHIWALPKFLTCKSWDETKLLSEVTTFWDNLMFSNRSPQHEANHSLSLSLCPPGIWNFNWG